MPSSEIILGDGCTQVKYQRPRVTDTAVLICFYNFCHYKRPYYNALYTLKLLYEAKIPTYVVEVVKGGETEQLVEPDLVLRTNSYMFYKEQAFNELVKIVPPEYTKFIFLDADILYEQPDWVDTVSAALDRHDVVHPFQWAKYCIPTNRTVFGPGKESSIAGWLRLGESIKNPDEFHPGFAIAFRRDMFERMGGFFDLCIMGGGDGAMMNVLLGGPYTNHVMMHMRWTPFLVDAYVDYLKRVSRLKPSLGYTRNTILHLFHGRYQNRKYDTRYITLSEAANDPKQRAKDMVRKNQQSGLYEWVKGKKFNTILHNYFKGRDEDVPLEIAMRDYKPKKQEPSK
jgi:hypothetical protein